MPASRKEAARRPIECEEYSTKLCSSGSATKHTCTPSLFLKLALDSSEFLGGGADSAAPKIGLSFQKLGTWLYIRVIGFHSNGFGFIRGQSSFVFGRAVNELIYSRNEDQRDQR